MLRLPRSLVSLLLLLGGCGVSARGPVLPTQALAPEFVLPDAQGRPVSLRWLIRDSRLVLVFYRGHW